MIEYILKSSLSLLLLFGLYWFLLRKEKLFIFNRYFLLFSIVFSMAVPFISIPVNTQENEVSKNIFTALNSNFSLFSPEQYVINDVISQSNGEQFSAEVPPFRISLMHILLFLYVSGFLILLFRFLRNIYFIAQQVRYSEKVVYSEKRLVLIEDLIKPYCFYNTIFVNKNDYLKRKISIELLEHELEHINQYHTIDIVILEFIRIIYWFNPILLLYSKAIRVNHEYLADNGVIQKSPDIKSYALELINFTCYGRNIPLTSGFNHSLTKRRLIMITKSQSNRIISKVRIIVTLTLFLIIASFISLKESKSQSLTSSASHATDIDTILINNDSVNANMASLNVIKSFNVTDKEVRYTASGSIKRDSINKTVVLIGNAVVKFGEITINADSIVFNMKTKELFAIGRKDSFGQITGNPIMKEGSMKLNADEITVNLESHKAMAKNIKARINVVPKDSSGIGNEKPGLFPIKKGEYYL